MKDLEMLAGSQDKILQKHDFELGLLVHSIGVHVELSPEFLPAQKISVKAMMDDQESQLCTY